MNGVKLLIISLIVGAPWALAEDRVNPFKSHHAEHDHDDSPRVAASAMALKAILASGIQPLANISGEILAVGDTYKGYRVEAITANSVTLVAADHRRELRLHDPLVAQATD